MLIGSLLGDCYGNKISGEGTRFCYRQSIVHKDYLFLLYNFFIPEDIVLIWNLENILKF